MSLLCTVFALAVAERAKAQDLSALAKWALANGNQTVARYVLNRSRDPYTRKVAAAALASGGSGSNPGQLDLSNPNSVNGLGAVLGL